MNNDIGQLITTANPAPVTPEDADSPQAQATLQRILHEPAPTTDAAAFEPSRTHRRRGWRYAVAAVAIAAVAAVVGLAGQMFGGGGAVVFAATPPLLAQAHAPTATDASSTLQAMAKHVSKLPDDTGTGPVAEVTMQSWSLFTRIDGEQVTSAVVPQDETIRTSGDGAATVTREYSYQGEHNENFTTNNELNYPVGGLSSNDTELARQLAIGQPASNGTAGRFDSIVQAYRQAPVTPAARAAVLRFLASFEGVEMVGKLDDRLGRPGEGFIVDSDYSGLPTRYMLIFDPQTGQLLDYEETLTSDAGKLNVHTPAVISYIAFKKSQFTN